MLQHHIFLLIIQLQPDLLEILNSPTNRSLPLFHHIPITELLMEYEPLREKQNYCCFCFPFPKMISVGFSQK